MILLIVATACLTIAGCFYFSSFSFNEAGLVSVKKHYKTIAIIFFVIFVASTSLLCIGNFLTKKYTTTYEVTEYETTEESINMEVTT